MNLPDLINRAEALQKDVQAAIEAGEHVVATLRNGTMTVPHLVQAASSLGAAVQLLDNHQGAVDNLLAIHGTPPPAVPAPAPIKVAPAPTGTPEAPAEAPAPANTEAPTA